MSNLVDHAKREIQAAGLFDADSDYDGETGKAALELVEVFSKQGHSGGSAHLVLEVFNRLARFKPLTPLTTNPDEWMEVEDGKMWQNLRQSSVFSNDGGKTAYDVDKDGEPVELQEDGA
jgi:hypothetical protein